MSKVRMAQYGTSHGHAGGKMRAMLAHRPEESYSRIVAPTLVIRGEGDPVSPHDWCRFVVEEIPETGPVIITVSALVAETVLVTSGSAPHIEAPPASGMSVVQSPAA